MDRKTMTDVREALWNAYKIEEQEGGIEGKSSEAYCELIYPTYYSCKTIEKFSKPYGINIYSYALGPSRMHHILYAETENKRNYYTWESPDIYAKAIEVIESWTEERRNESA